MKNTSSCPDDFFNDPVWRARLIRPLCDQLQSDSSLTPSLRAAVIYLARKERLVHPAGKFDSGRRFFPAASESFLFPGYRAPSRRFPFSYMTACRSLYHVTCSLLDLEEAEMRPARRLVRQGWPVLLEQCRRELPPEVAAKLGLTPPAPGSSSPATGQ